MKRAMLALALCGSAACSSGTSPTAPTTTTTVSATPTPSAVRTVSGTVVATNGGQPLSGVSVSAPSVATATTDTSGRFTLPFSATAANVVVVTLSGTGIVPRTTLLSTTDHTTTIDVFSTALGFDLTFFRRIVRNGTTTIPIINWAGTNPSFYIQTVNDKGQALDPAALDIFENTVRSTIGAWTGSTLSVASVTRGSAAPTYQSGQIGVTWSSATGGDACGQALVGGNAIQIDPSTPGCRCAGLAIDPAVVKHELGHAMGFYHSLDTSDIMYFQRSGSCTQDLSARERQYATYMYTRTTGNRDPDSEPSTSKPF